MFTQLRVINLLSFQRTTFCFRSFVSETYADYEKNWYNVSFSNVKYFNNWSLTLKNRQERTRARGQQLNILIFNNL